jgi:hypothetical protein
MVDLMLELQQEAAKKWRELHRDLVGAQGFDLDDSQAQQLMKQVFEFYTPKHEGGTAPFRMILAGMDTRDEHVRNKCSSQIRELLTNVARGRCAGGQLDSLI